MITDIPTPLDFERNGLAFLHLAWETIVGLSQDFSDSIATYERDEIPENERVQLIENYWIQSQPALASSVALVHQGGEFLLKSRISAVSPFLLLSPEKWPGNSDLGDKSFADFKTVDAQDLIRIHDTVCQTRLSDEFRTRFETLRRLRNTIMHSVDSRNPFRPRDGVLAILEIADTLIGANSWLGITKKLQEEKRSFFDPHCYSKLNPNYPFAERTLHVINVILTTAEAKRFFNFDKRRRSYLCTACHEPYAEGFVWSVQLTSKSPTSAEAFCVCCQKQLVVRREQCGKKQCKGNVLGLDSYEESWTCLTCNLEQYPADENSI